MGAMVGRLAEQSDKVIWRWGPVPHVDWDQGSFYFLELVGNGLLYAGALALLIGIPGVIVLAIKDARSTEPTPVEFGLPAPRNDESAPPGP
jgi:hypothetical protein